MKKVDICIYQGEDFVFQFDALEDNNYDAIDISLYTGKMQVRRLPRSRVIEIEITDGLDLGSDGVITVTLDNSETKILDWPSGFYDVRLTSPSSDVSFPYSGIVVVIPSITLDISDFNNDFNSDFGI